MTKKRQKKTSPIKVTPPQKVDLFDAMCGNSRSKEACQRFVDKLEESSQNYANKSDSD